MRRGKEPLYQIPYWQFINQNNVSNKHSYNSQAKYLVTPQTRVQEFKSKE